MSRTPAEWLNILTERMDRDAPRYRRLERYVNGDAPLPELSKDTTEAWSSFQKEARTNFGATIRDAVADRVVPIGLTVGGSVTSQAAKAAALVWRDNRMDQVVRELVLHGLTYSKAFLTVMGDEGDDMPIVAAASPLMVAADTDSLQPWKINAAVRVWRNVTESRDYARVMASGWSQLFSRPTYSTTRSTTIVNDQYQGGWEPVGDPEVLSGAIPVVVYESPSGLAAVEPHTDIIDRINRSVLNLLTTSAMQAFKQRALQTPDGKKGLPQKDEHGNVIDWAKIFEPAPAALWNLPPGVSVWEGSATDTNPMLNAIVAYVKHLSAASGTPLPILMPDSANQSAAGAENTEKSFIFKVRQWLLQAKLAVEAALVLSLESLGKSTKGTVDVTFEDPTRVLLTEKYAAAVQTRATGLSLRTIQTLILGMTPEEIEQDAANRALEQRPQPVEVIDAEVVEPGEDGPLADNRLRDASPEQ